MRHEDTNVGLGMVPHRKSCRCLECDNVRIRTELAAAQARIKALEGKEALYLWLMCQQRSMWDAISKAIDGDAAVKSEYRRQQSGDASQEAK